VSTTMSEYEMRELIRSMAAVKTWRGLGDELGYSGQYLHRVCQGERPVSESLARQLGYRRLKITAFERINGNA